MNAPVLALPDFSKTFIVDVILVAQVWVLLSCKIDPLLFSGHTLQVKNVLLFTYKKEMLALVLTVLKWQKYLLGRQCIVKTYLSSIFMRPKDYHYNLIKMAL